MDVFRSCRFTRHLTNGCVHARYEWYGGYCYYPATGWRCRQSPYYCDTAHALAGYEAMCLAASMNGYATKPISQKKFTGTCGHLGYKQGLSSMLKDH